MLCSLILNCLYFTGESPGLHLADSMTSIHFPRFATTVSLPTYILVVRDMQQALMGAGMELIVNPNQDISNLSK